uniref:RNA-directed RNA polymerase n=1 Tax=Panagrolaimus sp. ES5 TaxID=591445 RepID=A0AC34FSQ4_9BILA
MIFCNVSFRGYSQNNLQKFDEFLLKHNFESIENFTKVSSSHHDTDIYGMDEHDEYQYSFTLKEVTKKISCEGTCVSIAELNCVLDQYQYELKEVDLDKNALYSFTLKSKDFYPKEFSLQSIFPVHRVVFGNIFNKNFFNPVLAVRSEKKSSALQEFLRTQKSFPDFVYNMGTLFEHDQKSFSVFFNDFYGDSARVIELKVPYSSIRRIIASMSYIDSTVQCGITFQLAFPPLVFPHRQQSNGTNENDPKFFIRNRYPTWNGNFAKEEDICLSTCLAIDCYDMEPCSVLSTLDRLQKITGKEIEFGDRISDNKSFLKHRFYEKDFLQIPEMLPENLQKLKDPKYFSLHRFYEKDFLQIPEMLPENLQKLKDPKYFSLVYAIESIVCRGGEVYDYFFRKPNPCFETFLQLVSEKFESDLQREPNKKLTKTVRALELMFEKFDYLLDIPEPITFFTKCYEQLSEFESTSELIKKGFMRVRKIIVTPTRVLLCNPDIVAGNRCLRMCGSDNMIRVIFRDDNSSKLYGVQRILISKTVENFLKFPLCIAIPDYVGGEDANGNPYTFSDGVGIMSREIAKKIAIDLGYPD